MRGSGPLAAVAMGRGVGSPEGRRALERARLRRNQRLFPYATARSGAPPTDRIAPTNDRTHACRLVDFQEGAFSTRRSLLFALHHVGKSNCIMIASPISASNPAARVRLSISSQIWSGYAIPTPRQNRNAPCSAPNSSSTSAKIATSSCAVRRSGAGSRLGERVHLGDAAEPELVLPTFCMHFVCIVHTPRRSRCVKGVGPHDTVAESCARCRFGGLRICVGGERPYGEYFQQPYRAGREQSLSRRGRLFGNRHRAHVRREQIGARRASISPSQA